MNPFELVEMSFGALRERKLRSGLTVLMVIIGAGLMTSLNGLTGGMNNFINEQLGSLGANVIIVTPGGQVAFGPMEAQGSQTKLTPQTVQTIGSISGMKYVVPFYSGVATLKSGGEEKTATIVGIDQSKLEYIAPKISFEIGAFGSIQDSVGIVLGHNIAYPSDLNKPLAKMGQAISVEFSKVESEAGREKVVVKKKSFQVRGIIEELGNMQVDNQVYISPAAANAFFEKGGTYDGIYGITRDPDVNDKVEQGIRKIYGKNIGVTSPKAMAKTIGDIMGTFTGFMSAIAAVSMFVGAVGIVTTLYTSVMERTREIGLLKAIGYDRTTVLFMFLTESITIGVLGGLLGLAFGVVGAYVLIRVMPFGGGEGLSIAPYFLPMDIARVFLISLVLSVAAGIYPAWRAAKLSPITALRKE